MGNTLVTTINFIHRKTKKVIRARFEAKIISKKSKFSDYRYIVVQLEPLSLDGNPNKNSRNKKNKRKSGEKKNSRTKSKRGSIMRLK